MLLSFSIRHTHDPVYAVAGAKIHHNTFVYNSRICGGGQVGTEVPAPPLRTSPHALRVNTELLRTSCSRNSMRHSHSGLSAFVFMSRHPVKCATCREQALACALDGIITRKKHPACDMRRQDASKQFIYNFEGFNKLKGFTARITAARMLGMAKLSLEAPSQAHQQAFSLCQMLQILCCGST